MPRIDPLDLLPTATRLRPDGPAVVCGELRLSYRELAAQSERIGAGIAAAGVRRGDRVAALFPNCHLFLATYFAALAGELILVPLNLRLHPGEMLGILEHCGAKALVGVPGLIESLLGRAVEPAGSGYAVAPLSPGQEGLGEVRPVDAAHIYYTSGTTGRPKGVILSRANLAAHVEMTLDELSFGCSDVWLHAAPMFHLADAWAVWTVTACGGTHVMLPRFNARAALDLANATGVTITNLVPTMLSELLVEAERRGERLSSLRLMLSGGAPIAPRTVARVRGALGGEYAQTYGLTETSPFLTFSLPDAARTFSPGGDSLQSRARTGRAARGIELRVVQCGDGGRLSDVPADDRTVGEIIVSGATVTNGYWRDPEATREAFRDGWFHTGDLGTIDASGSVNLVDRAKDVIVTGGETVYSTEVEHVLHEHPEVREAAVFGVPHKRWGESVRAAVVLEAARETTPEDLVTFCRGRIARFKCPRSIEVVPALPRTGSGKIDKKALREPFWKGREKRIN